MEVPLTLSPGQRITHPDYGEGIVVSVPADGFLLVFFGSGERQVPASAVTLVLGRSERILRHLSSSPERIIKAWLCYQAHVLPLLASTSAMTAARIDLLPHQVVITHRVATASPRQFLIADEVGLGKTIETALILRELASRGELKRALMVVPAGLVNNWHRELNEVFHLGFEIFGGEGDVTDRKSNAFQKHNFLIASIDTLKRKSRLKYLEEAPIWDMVVFDESHHLTAYKSGSKLYKTQNYKLAELLRNHARDMLLLSATPHQGDHFRFWMLIQLLDPTLFTSPEDMVENRHRLNSIIFRRTKADACRADGSTVFARRWVHTESFLMSEEERIFYHALVDYLRDGFALAKKQGNQGKALGFVMTIFQKIAASSFAAVKRTLRRRLLSLTIQEGLWNDQNLDIEAREACFREARSLIHLEYNLGEGQLAELEVDRILAELKHKLLKNMSEEELGEACSSYASELVMADAEEAVSYAVKFALPEERSLIKKLLQCFPEGVETKIQKLLQAMGALWREDPTEKVVIFTTYLGSVESLYREIEAVYPGQGCAILKGGDHNAKLAAEKKFRNLQGPKVLICTAAGREGINLQFASVMFNFDLPWNPMELEQRIGRIHRYGQKNTAQVYNLVLSDTIEGKMFLLLDDKLKEIAKTLGRLDELGNIAEDFRTQILGQLSERLNYEKLYKEAISDPQLKRTRLEVETAMANALEARNVVFELFQNLDRFSLDDYKPFLHVQEDLDQLAQFLSTAVSQDGKKFLQKGGNLFTLMNGEEQEAIFTIDRELCLKREDVQLLGIDHPILTHYLRTYQNLSPEQIGISVKSNDGKIGILTLWYVEIQGKKGETKSHVIILATDENGKRIAPWEKQIDKIFQLPASSPKYLIRESMLHEVFEPMLLREMNHRGQMQEKRSYMTKLIGWVEVV